MTQNYQTLLTKVVHGDHKARSPHDRDVAMPLHPTTIFTYPPPEELHRVDEQIDMGLNYSRCAHHNDDRVEATLSELLDGHALAYSSGLSAYNSLLLNLTPKRLFIGKGYYGIHDLAHIVKRNGLQVHNLAEIAELAEKGDIVHLETPVNPVALALDISAYAKLAHQKGAILVLDATFAPPPLQFPFSHGADVIFHSASKYLGGHSDLLAGILVTQNLELFKSLKSDREHIGSILMPYDAWMLHRSLKTFPLRLQQQSRNVNAIIKFLSSNIDQLSKLTKVYHSNLQEDSFVKEQLPLGGSPTFSIAVTDEETAKRLPSSLKLFYHATSLGSVHSCIEWRAAVDNSVEPNLLRVSVGIEGTEDLIADLAQALW